MRIGIRTEEITQNSDRVTTTMLLWEMHKDRGSLLLQRVSRRHIFTRTAKGAYTTSMRSPSIVVRGAQLVALPCLAFAGSQEEQLESASPATASVAPVTRGDLRYAPLARAVLGGLTVSDLVPVFLVPIAYLLILCNEKDIAVEGQA